MAYNEEKLTKLKALKQLSERIAADYATKKSVTDLSKRVDDLVTAGGEPNVITAVKVNGEALPVTDKAVDVGAAIASAVSKAGHASFEKADAVPSAAEAEDNVMYLVMNAETSHYDIYAKVGEEVVLLDDTTVDLSGKVDKVEGKGLSANDYTDEDKAKLAGVAAGATKVEASETPGSVKVNGEDVSVVEIASDTEVTEMLAEVFGAAAN